MNIKKYINRELSWLDFNERVLQEAQDVRLPLLERLKFLGIYSSNLDEFFSVRVGTLQKIIEEDINAKTFYGGSPKTIWKQINAVVLYHRLIFDETYKKIKIELEKKENIYIIDETKVTPEQKRVIEHYFLNNVRPRLIPLMLSSKRPFPYLKNLSIYLACVMKKKIGSEKKTYAMIEIPADVLPRYFKLPDNGTQHQIIMLDDIIRLNMKHIFTIFDYDSIEAYTIKLTRNAEFDVKDDVTSSFFNRISEGILQREYGKPVRFVYDDRMPKAFLEYILSNLNILDLQHLVPGGKYHNAKDMMDFPNFGKQHLTNPPVQTIAHPILTIRKSLLKQIEQHDVLLHFPYQSFHHIIDMLREAAIDDKVTTIKMTLYRVAKNSGIVNALINAARNGKKVVVLLELQARFDEAANIYWTEVLEREGVTVLSGVPGLKVHSKICLITAKRNKKKISYAIIGTGNYNENTAKLYTDHALITCNSKITKEISNVFTFLKDNYRANVKYKELWVSPFTMRKNIKKYVRREIKNAEAGHAAKIILKVNNLIDKQIIDQLYKANNAGVKIKLIVRSTCSLIPEIENLSNNIEVVSIVDKFLEHSRLYYFQNIDKPIIYLSSADIMVRNLDNRVEVATPILDPKLKQELIEYLDIQLNDDTKARYVNSSVNNEFVVNKKGIRAQDDIYNYLKELSIHTNEERNAD